MFDQILWVIAIVSFVGTLVAIGVRDRIRKRLSADAEPFLRESPIGDEWAAAHGAFLSSMRYARRARIIERNLTLLPMSMQQRFARMRLAQRVLVFFVTLMFVCYLLVALSH